jgi:hypothetical protein
MDHTVHPALLRVAGLLDCVTMQQSMASLWTDAVPSWLGVLMMKYMQYEDGGSLSLPSRSVLATSLVHSCPSWAGAFRSLHS